MTFKITQNPFIKQLPQKNSLIYAVRAPASFGESETFKIMNEEGRLERTFIHHAHMGAKCQI